MGQSSITYREFFMSLSSIGRRQAGDVDSLVSEESRWLKPRVTGITEDMWNKKQNSPMGKA